MKTLITALFIGLICFADQPQQVGKPCNADYECAFGFYCYGGTGIGKQGICVPRN